MLSQTKIGTLLHEDHMATIETLQGLEEFLGRNKATPKLDDTAKAFLGHLAKTLREEVEKHFGFEENHLFPVFIERGETGIVMMLTHEHRVILPLAVQVAELATAAAESGFDAQNWLDFRDAGSELVEREIFHVQKEEMGLLSAISALVAPDVDARLAETYREVVG
ncbi:MAG: hemerythrin domain-containing protein [Rhodospirillaceae bacterium]|nr:hemerythrin domain-containing protein [Rhodospirillales bacterium]